MHQWILPSLHTPALKSSYVPVLSASTWTWPSDYVFLSSAREFFFFFFWLFAFSRATLTAYGVSQARGPMGAVATGLHQSHSNAGSEMLLQPTPQLTATSDCQGILFASNAFPSFHPSLSPYITLIHCDQHPKEGWTKEGKNDPHSCSTHILPCDKTGNPCMQQPIRYGGRASKGTSGGRRKALSRES